MERKIFSSFVEGLKRKAESLNPGWPNHEQTDLGPLISAQHRDKVLSYYRLAQEEGAHLITGGGIPKFSDNRNHGFYVQPTIYTGLPESARCIKEEIFGPVCHIAAFDSEEEAIAMANDTKYGLAASILSADLARAQAIADQLRVGIIHINDQTILHEVYGPIGGHGASGNGYSYSTLTNADQFTEWQWITSRETIAPFPF